MNFYPLLFKTPMVQATLDGRKTQTRRTNGLEIVNENPDYYQWLSDYNQLDIPRPAKKFDDRYYYAFTGRHNNSQLVVTHCPYGKPGDVLWVRETFCYFVDENGYTHYDQYLYKADNSDVRRLDGDGFQVYNKNGTEASPWIPSIHMPKAACRLFIKVKAVRVERLQDITEQDAIAEGIEAELYIGVDRIRNPRSSFCSLWRSINGPTSWKENPWVWVIEFERIEKPKNFLS